MDDWEVRRVATFDVWDAAARAVSPTTPVSHVRVRRGVYVDSSDWAGKEREARHFVRMQSVCASMKSAPVFSHQSAALIWGLPVVGVPMPVQLTAAGRVRVRSQRGIRWHNDALRDDEIVEVGGFLVTNLERTLVDLARICSFASAVAALDAGIGEWIESPIAGRVRGANTGRLGELVSAAAGRRGIRAARVSVGFADARSGSAGESVSRANLHLLGFPAPELQVPFRRYDGGVDIVDFDWPELGMFGEFDGRGKYLRDEYTADTPIEEILLAEKDREDRIRRHRPFGVRWGWDIGRDPLKLHRHLVAHGLHPSRARVLTVRPERGIAPSSLGEGVNTRRVGGAAGGGRVGDARTGSADSGARGRGILSTEWRAAAASASLDRLPVCRSAASAEQRMHNPPAAESL